MKQRILAIVLILALVTLSGCWNEDEPKDLASVNSILYDIDDDGKYRLVIEVLSPLPSGGGGGDSDKIKKSPLDPISGEGDSIREALVNLARSVEKRIFAGHNKVRLFTERFALKGMLPMLEVSSRDRLMDETPLMIVVKAENPDEVFSSAIGLSDMVGDYFENLATQQERHTSKAVTVTTLDFIKDYYLEGKQPVMGVAQLIDKDSLSSKSSGSDSEGEQQSSESGNEEGEDEKIIVYEGLAAFKEDKLVGYMNAIETRSYNLITKSVNTSLMSLPPEDQPTVVRISNSKANIKTFLENDKVSVLVNIKATLHVVEESGDLDVTMPEPLKTVEARFNKLMEKEVAKTVLKAQTEFKSDIFGFGRQLHIQHPNRWPDFKDDWDEHFSKASVEIAIESSVVRSGQIKKPLSTEDE
ncbi:MAG: Ger(x)C family spore germination protein [Christensenellales bacterium]|jgi:spore germination protein KC